MPSCPAKQPVGAARAPQVWRKGRPGKGLGSDSEDFSGLRATPGLLSREGGQWRHLVVQGELWAHRAQQLGPEPLPLITPQEKPGAAARRPGADRKRRRGTQPGKRYGGGHPGGPGAETAGRWGVPEGNSMVGDVAGRVVMKSV